MQRAVVWRTVKVIVYPMWTISAVMLAVIIISAIVQYVLPTAWYDWLQTAPGSLVLVACNYVCALMIILLPLIVVGRLRHATTSLRHVVGVAQRPQLAMIPWSLFVWGLYFSATIVVMMILSLIKIDGIDLSQQQTTGFDTISRSYEYIAAFIALVILAPLFEEMIFRGFLYGRLRQYSGVVVSTLLTSGVFAFLHFQFNVGVDVFVLSVFLCFLREKFDSIWPAVFVHMFKNGLAYTLLFILPLYGMNLLQ